MKKKILFTAIAASLSLTISSYHDGPARHGYDCTGAELNGVGNFANSNGCYFTGNGCHNTTATTSITVAIELDSAGIPTTHYMAGHNYTVKITGTPGGTSNTHYGFQLNALKGTVSTSSNADAGTWASTGLPANTQKTAPGMYTQLTCMEHSATHTLSGSSFSESFTWTAPAFGTGTISFWGAANFVNGNDTADAADVWNTNHLVINEWAADASVAAVTRAYDVIVYPNPVNNVLYLEMNNAVPGTYSLEVFDVMGRSIARSDIKVSGASNKAAINTSEWAYGTYNVVIERDGVRQVQRVVKL